MSKLAFKMIAVILAVFMTLSFVDTLPVSAKSKNKEKKEATLSKSSVEANTYEEFSIRLKSSHEAWYYYCSVRKYDEQSGNYISVYGSSYTYTYDDDGKFTFTFFEGGKYEITITLVEEGDNYEYYYYSDKCTAIITNIGPKEHSFALLVGSTRELEVENCEFISARVKEADNYWYNDWDDWYDYDYGYNWYNSGEVEINGNKITGTKTGDVTLIVSYLPDDGKLAEAEIQIAVTDPQYKPIEGYVLAGNYVYLQISDISNYSIVTIESDDESICRPNGQYHEVYIESAGKCNLKITVDGKEFTDQIEAYDPRISSSTLLLKKNKSEKLTVTGLPDGIEPVFKSDNKKIAAVTKDGKVKAKAVGNACITVTCGDFITFSCVITVSKGGIGYEAAKKAYKAIGGKYSQEKRMSEGYYDCSSLAWRSYKEAGKALAGESKYAPTAADLAKKLESEGKAIAYEYISAEELQPGDLIFYSSGSNGRYKNIDHVAVYYAMGGYYSDWDGSVTSVGTMVHATSPAVSLTAYDWYIPYCIVMICRPE